MPGRRRFAALSLTALLAFGACATEGPGPEDRAVAAPLLSPGPGTYSAAMDVALTTATLGASIRYTTDGSTPSETAGTLYMAPVRVDATLTIKAVAFRTGWTTSPVSTGLYTIRPLAATPAFDPAPGTYHDAQDVAMSTATSGASIRYTTDGSTPTATAGTLYTAPVHIAANTVLRAAAFGTDLTTSIVAWGQYVIGPAVTAPAFAPPPGAYEGPQDIVLTSLTAGASIRYTTDGSEPSETVGTLYAAPVRLLATRTLKALAFRAGWDASPVTSGLYTISTLVAAPVFAPPPGTYDEAQEVAITTTTAGASIRYTTDGTAPTASLGTVYTGPVAIAETLTLRAVAYRAGWTT
ncbi:MAG: chitobiase/beta-hexosaminidase C-terminal domain-containing protein, partial [Acidobacteria bacterium]|nr:chitobiase/beta-hexosaminidase C-terminal domain-containing protein [Acidobacteriota bacterium]